MTRSRRRSYGTIRDATKYGGKVSTGDGPNFTRPPGSVAWFDGTCWICDQPITANGSQIVLRKGDWIHVHCAPGYIDGER